LFLRRRRRLRSASFDAFPEKKRFLPSLLLLRAKNDVDVNDDDVEEAAMMMTMTTTRGNPMNFYLARGRLLLFEKKTPLSLSLLAPAERDEERDLETERERNNSALLFFNSLSSLSSSLSSSFGVMNSSSSLQRNERTIEFFPRTRKKKLFVARQKNLKKTKQQKKKAFR